MNGSHLLKATARGCVGLAVVAAFIGMTHASGSSKPIEVRLGHPAFWTGVYDASGSHHHVYTLEVGEGADLLRVGIDVPTRTDWYRVEVYRPSGSLALRFRKQYAFSAEGIVKRPQPGKWKLVVSSQHVSDSVFRMRAALQESPNTPSSPHKLLPDLRAIPPFDFTFTAPQDGAGSDFDNDPNADLPTPVSCAQDEMTDDNVVNCLRFSAGIEDAGAGPLDLRFDPSDANRRVFQVIHYADGAVRKRRAGQFEWHESHKHFHYKNIWSLKLVKVTNRSKGEMSPVVAGHKSGFCPADQRIADWHRFDQAPAYSYGGNCGVNYEQTPTGDFEPVPVKHHGTMAFSPGWGDVYGWYRPGNYVDFGASGDGLYVVRVSVDGDGHVEEKRNGNNTSYALIRVTGNEISTLERGRGSDPWDPNKVVVKDWWRGLKQ